MKKLSALFVIFAVIFALNSVTYSQPQVVIHVTGGYNLPLPDLKGDYTIDSLGGFSTTDSNSYLIKSGFSAGADFKYALGKKRNLRVGLGLTYNMFNNNQTSGSTTAKIKMNIFQVAAQVEYAIMPKGKANPFIGLDLTGNFFSGSTDVTRDTSSASLTLKSASRFGVGIGAGLDIAFSKSIGAVIGVKYQLANLIGKEAPDTSATPSTTEYTLSDKEYTMGGVTHSAKNISYINLYAGLAFFLNQPKKTMKK